MKVILIVGPSGAGKDTLLRGAKEHFFNDKKVGFTRRYITRPPDENEDNFYVDEPGFISLKKTGFFASSWAAHHKLYGIPKHPLKVVGNDGAMLCSVSRAVIADFESQFDRVTTINVTARKDILRDRLVERGREPKALVLKRLTRVYEQISAREIIEFDNSTNLDQSMSSFIQLLDNISNS